MTTSLVQRIEEFVRRRLSENSDGHDWDHTLRVRNNALLLARAEGADLEITEIAALLHDIARPQESSTRGGVDHAVLGAEEVLTILPELGLTDPRKIERISACIRHHRFRRREGSAEPETIEEKVLFDADKLDSLGAIGVARAIHFAGHIGARVHNTQEEALGSESYSHEDSAYREYLVKLRHLPERMLTETGRKIALSREGFMKQFFEELNSECQ